MTIVPSPRQALQDAAVSSGRTVYSLDRDSAAAGATPSVPGSAPASGPLRMAIIGVPTGISSPVGTQIPQAVA